MATCEHNAARGLTLIGQTQRRQPEQRPKSHGGGLAWIFLRKLKTINWQRLFKFFFLVKPPKFTVRKLVQIFALYNFFHAEKIKHLSNHTPM